MQNGSDDNCKYTVLCDQQTQNKPSLFYILGTRFKEGCNINRSLFTLGQVIKRLTDEGQK